MLTATKTLCNHHFFLKCYNTVIEFTTTINTLIHLSRLPLLRMKLTSVLWSAVSILTPLIDNMTSPDTAKTRYWQAAIPAASAAQ